MVGKSAILKKPAICNLRIDGEGSRFLQNITPYLPGCTMYTQKTAIFALQFSQAERTAD
jgi:hypothetical protein